MLKNCVPGKLNIKRHDAKNCGFGEQVLTIPEEELCMRSVLFEHFDVNVSMTFDSFYFQSPSIDSAKGLAPVIKIHIEHRLKQ
jgi:hypothetical protein